MGSDPREQPPRATPASKPPRANPREQTPASKPPRANPREQTPASKPPRANPREQTPASKPPRANPREQPPRADPREQSNMGSDPREQPASKNMGSDPREQFSYDNYESKIHEQGNNVQPIAKIVTAKKATVKITTKNINLAMTLIDAVDVGDDIYESTSAKTLSMTPIGVESQKILTFSNAFLDPTLSYAPKAGEDHTATLAFVCLPDSTTGKVFTWATGA